MLAGAIAIATTVNAQKGGILLGGSIGVNSSNSTDEYEDEYGDTYEEATRTMSVNFSPAIGYNISDKFMAGLWFDIVSGKTTYEETGDPDAESKSMGVGIGPFVRFTKNMGDIFSLYGQANIGFRFGHSTFDDGGGGDEEKTTSGGFVFNLFPAIGVNCGSGWALNFSFGGLGFDSMVSQPDDSDSDATYTDSHFNFGFNPQLNAGVSKTFGGKKD